MKPASVPQLANALVVFSSTAEDGEIEVLISTPVLCVTAPGTVTWRQFVTGHRSLVSLHVKFDVKSQDPTAKMTHVTRVNRLEGLSIQRLGPYTKPDMPPAPLVDLLSLPPLSNIISLTERFMGKSTSTPYSVFRVVPGARHRFRLIGATCLVCPAKVAIEDHNLLVIATDGTPIQPTLVDSIIILPGERYDVVIEAKESYRSSYWIHVRGLAACLWEGVHQVAILQYVGSKMIQPPTPYPGHKGFTKRNEVILNPDNADCGYQSSGICVDQLTNALPVTSNILKQTPDLSLILGFNFRVFTGQELFRSGTYHRFFQPPLPVLVAGQLNNISNMLPSSPILSQLEDIHPETFCSGNDSTLKECFHVIKIPLGAVVEFLLVDHTDTLVVLLILFGNTTCRLRYLKTPNRRWHVCIAWYTLERSEVPNGLTHPFHLHGYEFAVLAVGLFKRGQTPEDVQRELHSGELKREKDGPPTFKDTIAIPSTGFAVVRIKADNPGIIVSVVKQILGKPSVIQNTKHYTDA
uniref:Laccase n=1 Tax=Timema cristinae TaxID=61476 RepID=A0A7R9GQP4_TIMCR|nr:unnamed protein product [Timema cristinae]